MLVQSFDEGFELFLVVFDSMLVLCANGWDLIVLVLELSQRSILTVFLSESAAQSMDLSLELALDSQQLVSFSDGVDIDVLHLFQHLF